MVINASPMGQRILAFTMLRFPSGFLAPARSALSRAFAGANPFRCCPSNSESPALSSRENGTPVIPPSSGCAAFLPPGEGQGRGRIVLRLLVQMRVHLLSTGFGEMMSETGRRAEAGTPNFGAAGDRLRPESKSGTGRTALQQHLRQPLTASSFALGFC